MGSVTDEEEKDDIELKNIAKTKGKEKMKKTASRKKRAPDSVEYGGDNDICFLFVRRRKNQIKRAAQSSFSVTRFKADNIYRGAKDLTKTADGKFICHHKSIKRWQSQERIAT